MLRLLALFFVYLVFSWFVFFLLLVGAQAVGLHSPHLILLGFLTPVCAAVAAARHSKEGKLRPAWFLAGLALLAYIGISVVLFGVLEKERNKIAELSHLGRPIAREGRLEEWYPEARQQQLDPRVTFDRILRENPSFKPLVWPPPDPSALASIPSAFFQNDSTLADVASHLAKALSTAGYSKLSYFYAPYGFAAVTGIEQINDDGSPLATAHRWFAEPAIDFSLAAYLRLLLAAPVGRYRAIIFLVTTESFGPSGIVVTRSELARLMSSGGFMLPDLYRTVSFRSPPYEVDALIYEFRGRAGSEPVLVNPSAITGSQHLAKARILAALDASGVPQ
jgi:hypothetical protein